jgi:hypothetical protein
MANCMAGLPSYPGKQTTQAAVLLRSCFISFKRAAMATIANALTFPVDPLDQVTENADFQYRGTGHVSRAGRWSDSFARKR